MTVTCDTVRRAKIVTEYIPLPVPTDRFDWKAYLDDYEEIGPYGRGPTEAAAIADLREQLEDEYPALLRAIEEDK